MSDPTKCLILKNHVNNEVMCLSDHEILIEKRDRLVKDMEEMVAKFDSEKTSGLKLTTDSHNRPSLFDLNEIGRQLALINAKLDCAPISPSNPKIKDMDKLNQERTFLFSRIQQLEKEGKILSNQINLLNKLVGHLKLPETKNPLILSLMNERNIRVKMIATAMEMQHELTQKKISLEMQQQKPHFGLFYESIHTQITQHTSVINLNRGAISIIDDRMKRLDDVYMWNLMQIDEDRIQLLCERQKFQEKFDQKLLDIGQIRSRIGYINFKFNEMNGMIRLASKMNTLNVNGVFNRNSQSTIDCTVNNETLGKANLMPSVIDQIISNRSSSSVYDENVFCGTTSKVNRLSTNQSHNTALSLQNLIDQRVAQKSTGSSPTASLDFSGEIINSLGYNESGLTIQGDATCSSDASDESNDDLVLSDLDKEIEKAIHQVESSIQPIGQRDI